MLRSVGLAAVLGLVLLGLSGELGVKTRRTTATSPDGMRVSVTYASRARPGLAAPFTVTVTKEGGFDDQIEVAISSAYLATFDENGRNPEPDAATTNGDDTIWTYDPPDGETLTIWLDTRVEPGVQWRRAGSTTVTTGDDSVTVEHTTWILP